MYDLATKYCFCLSKDKKLAGQASLLLRELETNVNGAIIQAMRINRTRQARERKNRIFTEAVQASREYVKKALINTENPLNEIPEYPKFKKDFTLTRLHCDYHFYFVCIGQISKLLRRLSEVLNDTDLKNIYSKFEKNFNTEIRDHLEHIDERAVGKKYKKDIGHISDFGNFTDNGFSFNFKKYPVNKQKLDELKKIYEEAIVVLYRNYGSKDRHFLWQEQSLKKMR